MEKIKVLDSTDEKQLLIIPHADDELFGAYALNKIQGNNILYAYCGFTGSNREKENAVTRKKEFDCFIDSIKAQAFIMNDIEKLYDIIQDNNITRVYLPSVIDWHYEHRLTNYMLLQICNKLNRRLHIYWYMVTVPIITKRERLIVPMSKKEQREKYKLFYRVYKSQRHMPIKRFVIHEKLAVAGEKYYAAESFVEMEFSMWKKIVLFLQDIESTNNVLIREIVELKHKINSVTEIRAVSRGIFLELEKNWE